MFTALASAGPVTLQWSPVDGAAGYRVYYGNKSQHYFRFWDVGTNTVVTIVNLPDRGVFFAVTQYGVDGAESPFSNEWFIRGPGSARVRNAFMR